MMKNYLIRLLLTSCLFMLPFTASAQNDNPFIGTWDLDKSASDFGTAPVPLTMARAYQDLGGGTFMYLVINTNDDGSLGGSSATYKYDGSENPIASLNPGALASISYRILSPRTVEYTVRVGDSVTQIGAKTISSTNNVLTIAIQFLNEDGVFDNQILRFNKRQ